MLLKNIDYVCCSNVIVFMNPISPIDGYEIKCIAVGDSSVGKTSLAYRFINGKFDANMELTIGV